MAQITCAIIGEGSIALSCLCHVLESGFCVDVVITNTLDVIRYCNEMEIETFPRRKNIEPAMKGRSLDYVFSVNNPTILSPEVLSIAKTLTINYHDSLLPSYAGVHATSWAIIQGEKTHGISWHVVEPGIDTGDILQSQVVEISDDDSALTLNLKCFEACSAAFKRLVDDIVKDSLKPVPQNLQQRSYFGLYKTPPNLGVLCFEQNTEDIFNLARAMEFGAHDNQLGSPKICTPNGSMLLVTNARLTHYKQNGGHALTIKAGSVIDCIDNTIEVATSTSSLSLTVAELDGRQLNNDALRNYGVTKGVQIHSVSGLNMDIVTSLRKKEPFWRRTMRSYDATTLFVQKLNVLPDIIDCSEDQEIKSTKIPIPNLSCSDFQNTSSDFFILSSFIAFLARSCCSSQVHVGLVTPKKDIPHCFQQLYSTVCPVIFNIDFSLSVDDTLKKILEKVDSYREAGTFLVDMFYRYPDLRDIRRSPHNNIIFALENDGIVSKSEQKELLFDCHILASIGTENITISYANKLGNSYSRVEDVLRHFPAFLQSMTSQSKSLSLLDIDFVSPEEKETLYAKPHFQTWEESEDVLKYVNDVANMHLNKVAISTTTDTISYSNLLDEVSHLVYILQQNLPEDYRTELKCIALHMTNSIAYVISLLASMSANCPFLPLPQNLPSHRLAFMVQDARATVMLTTRDILNSEKFKEFQSSPEVLFEMQASYGNMVLLLLKNEQPCNQPSQPSSQLPEVYSFTSLSELASLDETEETPLHPDCCYVMYTSGSTGRPKGVQVLRSGVLNMALAQIDQWNLGPGDIIAQFASIGFDASISEIFTSLMSGATLAVLEESERLGKEFITAMSRLDVTTITLPPSVLNIYKPADFPKLQKVVTAGEACTISTAVRWTRNTNIRFFNAYGPTESTVCATIHEYDPTHAESTLSKELPIGKAIQGVQVYLFDDFMKPVPPNVVGEVFIGGQSLSAGYTGHASSKNEERFVGNPLFPGYTIYKTGDHALLTDDGCLTYIGRMDDQVKIRGQRVDLNEIEQVLLQHSKVEMAVVVKHQASTTSDPTIAAFIAPTFVFISELREYLSKALPCYMIPGYIKKMDIEDFPINLSGKIDRKQLERDPTFTNRISETDSSHLNDTQLKMAKLWCHVLQMDESFAYTLHRLSSFVEHGGNSLHMVLLQRAIEKEFGVLLSFTDIGGASTIQDFADMISRKNSFLVETIKSPKLSKEEWIHSIIQDSVFDINEFKANDSNVQASNKESIMFCPKNVLLSGATGFLGAFLLHEILEQTDAHVCCMVRESTEVRGFGRVVSNMKKYNLWKTSYDTRIAIVLSDISKTELGIAPNIYRALSTAVDTVFMNAAKMNFNTDYFDHRTANVIGTKQFIKFCFTGKEKFLFTTSSLGVFLFPNKQLSNGHINSKQTNSLDMNKNHDDGHDDDVNKWIKTINEVNKLSDNDYSDTGTLPQITINNNSHSNLTKTKSTYIELVSNGASFKSDYESSKKGFVKIKESNLSYFDTQDVSEAEKPKRVVYGEKDYVSDPSCLSGGYNQSKWVSEQLIQPALKYLPGGAIFRPARISGHSKTGVAPTNDLFACTLKGVQSLGFAPDLEFPYDLTPVDYCAKGMIEIMKQFYTMENHEMPLIYHFFNQATIPFLDLFKGMNVEPVSLEEWRSRVKSADRGNVLLPFTPFIESDFWDRSPEWPTFKTENTDSYISTECKKLVLSSEHLLKIYRGYFDKS